MPTNEQRTYFRPRMSRVANAFCLKSFLDDERFFQSRQLRGNRSEDHFYKRPNKKSGYRFTRPRETNLFLTRLFDGWQSKFARFSGVLRKFHRLTTMEGDGSFSEWEKFMDTCAKCLLENEEKSRRIQKQVKVSITDSQREEVSKKINLLQKGEKKGIKRRGHVQRRNRKKSVTTSSKKDGEAKVLHRSRSCGIKRQKSKSVNMKAQDQDSSSPQSKRQRQRSIAYDSGDVNENS